MSNKRSSLPSHSCPPLEVHNLSGKIWDSKVPTNGGPFHQQLEKTLCEYLGVEHIALFSNGTIALVTAPQTFAHHW